MSTTVDFAAFAELPARVAELARELGAIREELGAIRDAFPAKRLLSAIEAAEALGIFVPTIRRMIADGRLASVKIGR